MTFEYSLNLEGTPSRSLNAQKQTILNETAPTTEEDLIRLAAVLLEVVGLRQAVRLGDPRLWRQAISELNLPPLPPLNLPLCVWDLYQAHPFEPVALRLANGETVSLPDWTQLFYSWHSRRFALNANNQIHFYEADQVVAGESLSTQATSAATLDRLLWLQRAEEPSPFVVRTVEGQAFLVDGRDRFRVDPSGSLLVLNLQDRPLEFIPLPQIASVVVATLAPKVLLEQLTRLLEASPFQPFHIQLLHGGLYTVHRPGDVLVTSEKVYVAKGTLPTGVHESVWAVPLEWIDRFEILPSTPTTSPNERK